MRYQSAYIFHQSRQGKFIVFGSEPLAQPIDVIKTIGFEDLYRELDKVQLRPVEASYDFFRFWAARHNFEIPDARSIGFKSDIPAEKSQGFLDEKCENKSLIISQLSKLYRGLKQRLGIHR